MKIVAVAVAMFCAGWLAAQIEVDLFDTCHTTIHKRTASPNGKIDAVAYSIDCGATTSTAQHLALLPAQGIPNSSNGQSVYISISTIPISSEWLTNDQIEVLAQRREFSKHQLYKGIRISYRRNKDV